jgi:hypothetical protein
MSVYITGSKVTAKLIAPGGLQIGGIYDTSTTPVNTIVQTFGTNNISLMTQAIEQRSPDLRNLIDSSTTTIVQTQQRTVLDRAIQTITRMSESFRGSSAFGLFTSSVSPQVRYAVTSSARIEVDPARGSSPHTATANLYNVSASFDTGSTDVLRKTVSEEEFLQHRKTNENFKRDVHTENAQAGIITFANVQFSDSQAALDANDDDYSDNTKYISGSYVYDDSNFTTPYEATGDGYHKIKGELKTFGIFRSGRIYDLATGADKASSRDFAGKVRINVDGYDTQDDLKDAVLDPNEEIDLKFFNGHFYYDDYFLRPFQGNQKWYYFKTFNEHTRIDNNGTPMQSQMIM